VGRFTLRDEGGIVLRKLADTLLNSFGVLQIGVDDCVGDFFPTSSGKYRSGGSGGVNGV
jgi:hypothetical protein